MLICPSVLEQKPEDYFDTIKKLLPFYNYFQLDFSDGVYVKNKTADLNKFLTELTNHSPLVTNNLSFDFHLMIKEYETHLDLLESYKEKINIKNVFIHFDLSPKYLILSTKYSFPIGLVLNPQDQIGDLDTRYTLHAIQSIQIMSVVPGAQGKPFIPDILNKIEQLRDKGYRNKIYLDGGINDTTLPVIKSHKYLPDVICPGSYLTKTNNIEEHVNFLKFNS